MTIWVPSLSVLIGITSGVLGLFVLRIGFRKIKACLQAGKIEKKKNDARIEVLLPSPWSEAWNELTRIHNSISGDANPRSRNFLRHWLSEQSDLPRLSREAAHELACLLTFEWCDMWDDCLAILAPYSDVKPLADVKSLEQAEKARLATERKLEQKISMFNYPWDQAYEACSRTVTWEGAQLWLSKWIKEQPSLGRISVEAAEELMSKVAKSDEEDADYCAHFRLIAPYLETGYSPHRDVSDFNLEQLLPEEWFAFWKEIKDYPSRRSLFLSHLSHPIFRVPLTIEQAALLSRALGDGNETWIEFYAVDLTKCVVLASIPGQAMPDEQAIPPSMDKQAKMRAAKNHVGCPICNNDECKVVRGPGRRT